jgi:LysM repeat protein
MTGERYVVRPGDSLWNIAQATLGDGHQWKRLWRYNNRGDVVKITGRGIPNADLIHPGQVLLLPVLPGRETVKTAPPQPAPAVQSSSRTSAQPLRTGPSSPSQGAPALPRVTDIESPISVKYRLDDLKFLPMVLPGGVVEMKMTGDVIVTSKKTYPATYVTQRHEIETQVVTAANHAFGMLLNDTRLIYDASDKKLTYRSMLVSQSNIPGSISTAVGIQVDANSPVPKLRFEFRFPKVQGKVGDFTYAGVDVKIVIELTPSVERRGPSAQPLRAPQPSIEWSRVIGAGLVIAGVAIVVGTLVEDFFTAGAGVADDPASFAAAAGSVGRGLQLMGRAALPLAAVPATVNVRLRLENNSAPDTVVRPAR